MPERLLVDTDVMIDFLRGRPEGVDFIQTHADQIILSAIVVAELYAGVRNKDDRRMLDDLVAVFPTIPVTRSIATAGGLWKREFGPSHGTGLADAILAATAQTENARLVTRNVRHYPMFKDLIPAYTS